jgi:hypothetical protein
MPGYLTNGRQSSGIDQAIHEFDRLPRSGETVYGFAVGL